MTTTFRRTPEQIHAAALRKTVRAGAALLFIARFVPTDGANKELSLNAAAPCDDGSIS